MTEMSLSDQVALGDAALASALEQAEVDMADPIDTLPMLLLAIHDRLGMLLCALDTYTGRIEGQLFRERVSR